MLFLYISGDCELWKWHTDMNWYIKALTQNEMYWATVTPHAVCFIHHQQVKYVHLYIWIFNIYIQNNSALGLEESTGSLSFHTCFTSLYFRYLSRGESHFLLAISLRKCKPARDKLVFMLLLPAYHSLSGSEPKTKDLCTLTERWCLSDGFLCVDQETELCFLCSFISCFFFLYSTGFILLMHFDDEES